METKYNTNLASEFFVMSMLYRKGLDAYLTLGNKKGVDILVKKADGSTLKLEVKGVNKKSNDWPLSSGELSNHPDLYFIFISYESKIEDLRVAPRVWIIPAAVVKDKCKQSKKSKTDKYLKYMPHAFVRDHLSDYEDNWSPIENIVINADE